MITVPGGDDDECLETQRSNRRSPLRDLDWCEFWSKAAIEACFVVAWHLGKRDRINTEDFVSKIRWATAPGWFDISTDAFRPYETAIDAGLHDRANHAQVVKLFSTHLDRVSESYIPAKFVSVAKGAVNGIPDLDRAGTSHVEQKNGTLRQWCKRLSPLTYAFSKSWSNLRCTCASFLALQFCAHAFCATGNASKSPLV